MMNREQVIREFLSGRIEKIREYVDSTNDFRFLIDTWIEEGGPDAEFWKTIRTLL